MNRFRVMLEYQVDQNELTKQEYIIDPEDTESLANMLSDVRYLASVANIRIYWLWCNYDVDIPESRWQYVMHCVVSNEMIKEEGGKKIKVRLSQEEAHAAQVYIMPGDGEPEWPGYFSLDPEIKDEYEKVWVYNGQKVDVPRATIIDFSLALEGMREFILTGNAKYEKIQWIDAS